MRRRVCAALGALLAGACANLTEDALQGKVDYKATTTLPSLEVPPDLTSPARDNRYVVPETGKSTATYSGYQAERREQRPSASSAVLPEFDRIKIERAGTQRWLVVQEPPEKLWPLVKDFWQENGFLIKVELPEAGVMETDWAENRANIPQGGVRDLLGRFLDQAYSSSERDKYRTRLDRVEDGKGTEVYISHRGMQEVYTTGRDPSNNAPGATAWQARASDPEL
ncbi:MAG TPA: outer membrane protein assembly factor BamC, partial [Burkholderiales bacterium]|nr:outer membrane protein assembly factor BamC [Burkholderiales bacterium]